MSLAKRFLCPVKGLDCPYGSTGDVCYIHDLSSKGACGKEAKPFWEDENGNRYNVQDLFDMGYFFVNGEPTTTVYRTAWGEECDTVEAARDACFEHVTPAYIQSEIQRYLPYRSLLQWTMQQDGFENAFANEMDAFEKNCFAKFITEVYYNNNEGE